MGTAALTSRGCMPDDMGRLAQIFDEAVEAALGLRAPSAVDQLAGHVRQFLQTVCRDPPGQVEVR